MKRFWKIAGIATLVAILGVAGLGAVAFAQEGSDDESGWNFREQIHQAIASILGITVDEYDTAVETARVQVLEQAVAEGILTQEQADRIQERIGEGFGPFTFGSRRFGRQGFGFGAEHSLVAVAAEELGMTVDELLAELKDGKSIADVAQEEGVDPQAIADAFLAQRAEALAQAVENGRITQEQADQMLEHMTEEVQEHLEESFPFGGGRTGCWSHAPGGSRHDGARPGRFRSFPDQSES